MCIMSMILIYEYDYDGALVFLLSFYEKEPNHVPRTLQSYF